MIKIFREYCLVLHKVRRHMRSVSYELYLQYKELFAELD